MKEMKFFLLPFPLKRKTKKKTCAWSWICTFCRLPDCCKFQINSGIIVLQLSSEFGLYYFLLFIFLFFRIVLILNASFCYVWCLELFFVISLTFWSLFIEFFLHLPLSSLLFISLQKNLPFQRNQIVSSLPSIRFNFLHKGFLFLCFQN